MPVRVERKIFRVGDSNVVTVLKGWLAANGLKAGDKVLQIYNSALLIMPTGLNLQQLREDLPVLLASVSR
jgi:hypothetical protein